MLYLFLTTSLFMGCGANDSNSSSGASGDKSSRSSSSTETLGDVVATVNGEPIGSTSFSNSAKRKKPKSESGFDSEERKEILDQLIIDELLYQSALTKGYDKDPKVKKVMVNALLREEVYNSIKNTDISEEELKAYFDEHQSEFIVPEKVQIYSILIKVNDKRTDGEAKDKADRLYSELRKDPTKFREVATRESENPYKRRGGDVGFVPLEGKPGLDSAIVEKAFSMEVETLSEAFKTKDGWNVIYIPAKREKNVRSFEKMRGSVLRKVKNQKLKDNYDNYTAKLKEDAQLTVDEANLNKIEVKTTAAPSFKMPNGKQLGGGK